MGPTSRFSFLPFLFSVLLICGGISLFALHEQSVGKLTYYAQYGVKTTGVVVESEKVISKGPDSQTSFTPIIRYAAIGGYETERFGGLATTEAEEYPVGKVVQVVYDLSQPENSIPAQAIGGKQLSSYLVAASGLVILGVLMAIAGVSQILWTKGPEKAKK